MVLRHCIEKWHATPTYISLAKVWHFTNFGHHKMIRELLSCQMAQSRAYFMPTDRDREEPYLHAYFIVQLATLLNQRCYECYWNEKELDHVESSSGSLSHTFQNRTYDIVHLITKYFADEWTKVNSLSSEKQKHQSPHTHTFHWLLRRSNLNGSSLDKLLKTVQQAFLKWTSLPGIMLFLLSSLLLSYNFTMLHFP